MTKHHKDGRFFCEVCEKRFTASGDCSDCTPQEALLDLQDETVREFLEHQDDSRKRRRYGSFIIASLALSIPLAILMLPFVGDAGAIALAAFASMGLAWVLEKLFPSPRKAPKLAQEELATLISSEQASAQTPPTH